MGQREVSSAWIALGKRMRQSWPLQQRDFEYHFW